MVIKLRYGNTNTFLVRGESGYLLVDTDYAGTLSAFYGAIKKHNINIYNENDTILYLKLKYF